VGKQPKTAAELEKILLLHCRHLPIESVRVHTHWKRGWHARFIAARNFPNDIRPLFYEVLEGLRARYDLKKKSAATMSRKARRPALSAAD
jgi:hypothetical protein